MEAKINIVETLRINRKELSYILPLCGKCKLEEVDDKSFKISFYNSKFGLSDILPKQEGGEHD